MTTRALIGKLLALTGGIIMMVLLATGCSRDNLTDSPSDGMTVLQLRVRLNRPDKSGPASRVGEEYEPDKQPANNGEKMHTARIIIFDARGRVEHNTLWDLTAAPDIEARGQDFPVKANETKTIVLVANEDNAVVTDHNSNTMPATEYFRQFNANIGAVADFEAMNNLQLQRLENSDNIDSQQLQTPLAMSAVHQYFIGPGTHYSATFTIHRAAVKYTYRITNNDRKKTHTVNSIGINNVADTEYFFPQADFTDDMQFFWSAYRTPEQTGRELTFKVDRTIPAGQTVEIGPFYLPEGHNVAEGQRPYATAITFDGMDMGWRDIEWSIPQMPGQTDVMTDLPRNTHVIVNVSLNHTDFTIGYTVCPWSIHTTDIPSFN